MASKKDKSEPKKFDRVVQSEVVNDMELAGVVKTSKGFALAEVVLSPEGEVKSVRVGPSQAYPEFVVSQLRTRQLSLSLKTQRA